jgi:hypothetical protein
MAVGTALLLVLSVFVPTVAAAETTVSVETDAATDVTDRAATLNGNLTELRGADNATVSFEYWVEGDRANSTNTTEIVLGENATFAWGVSGLSNDTTYAYVAHAEANGTIVEGAARTFTTLSEPPLGVDTLGTSGVTPTAATLDGELTGLGGVDNATVHFEYWMEGERNDSATTTEVTLEEPGSFDANVSGLSYNETYVFVAHAEADNTTVTGDRVTFAPDMPEDGGDQPFGHWVSAFVHSLLDSTDSDERNLGQIVSEFVTENNPGADNRPDHAGPPEHAGPPGEDDDDESDESEDESDESDESEDDDDRDDRERGRPDHAGPPGEDDDENDESDDRRGPPEHAGPPDKGGDDGDDDDDDGSDDDDDDDDGSDGAAAEA